MCADFVMILKSLSSENDFSFLNFIQLLSVGVEILIWMFMSISLSF